MDYLREGESKFQEYSGLNFPATKDQILDDARRKHLPPEVIDRLEKIPDKKYDSVSDLVVAAAKNSL